jgi:hypothetical protein
VADSQASYASLVRGSTWLATGDNVLPAAHLGSDSRLDPMVPTVADWAGPQTLETTTGGCLLFADRQ